MINLGGLHVTSNLGYRGVAG